MFYGPIDVARLLAFAGVRDYREVAPVMTRQFALEFTSEHAARRGDERLRAVRVNGRPALRVARIGQLIAVSCIVTAIVDQSTQVECDADRHWSREDFFSIFRRVDLCRAG